jgi:anaerobic ribonucleoside-triphosphate reductase activating protein
LDKIYVTLQNSINNDGLWYPSISIYYSGCDKPIKCKECHNPSLQKQEIGYKTTSRQLIEDVEQQLIKWLSIYDIISICYVGGEPLAEWNRESVFQLSKYFKEKYNKQICNIFYSWRYIEDLHTQNLMNYLEYMDYGVLGEFQIQNKNLKYIPTSSNQYIYNFKNNKKIKPIEKGQ